jgi:hypothetical protein
MWQRKLRSRPDKHFPTNLAAKAFRYRGKRPRLCRVPRSVPELRDDSYRPAYRVGILPQLDTQSRPPGPSRLGARCSQSWRYFFSLHTKRVYKYHWRLNCRSRSDGKWFAVVKILGAKNNRELSISSLVIASDHVRRASTRFVLITSKNDTEVSGRIINFGLGMSL